jgi:carbonic anhydrase
MKKTDYSYALQSLKAGNQRFVTGNLLPKDSYTEDRKTLCEGQHPFAVVLCCSDSRVAPEIIFDQKLGDLFVIRNAGNVIDKHVLGSIEYAVEHLGTSLVVVMGHSCCGAVTATRLGEALPDNIMTIARRIRPSINTAAGIDDNVRRHAQRMAKFIQKDPIVKHMDAQVVSAFYDLQTGIVEWL